MIVSLPTTTPTQKIVDSEIRLASLYCRRNHDARDTRDFRDGRVQDAVLFGPRHVRGELPRRGDKELGRIISALILGVEDCSRDAVAAAVKNLRTDSMGPGTVVYFPGVKYYELG